MFCPKCGKQNADDARFCIGCGAALTGLSANAATDKKEENNLQDSTEKTEQPYLKYCDNVQKISKLTLIAQVLTVLMVLTLIFIPIYQCEYEVSIDEIESMEQLGEAFKNDGMITKDFSLFDDIMKMCDVFFGAEESESFDLLVILYDAIFPLFEIIFSIVLLCTVVPKLISLYNDRKNISRATMLKYNEMKLTGTKQTKQNFFKQQTIVSIILYAGFDVLFTVIFGSVFDSISDLSSGEVFFSASRYMNNFTGFSAWTILLLGMLVAFIVVQSMAKKEEKAMLIKVTEEQYS